MGPNVHWKDGFNGEVSPNPLSSRTLSSHPVRSSFSRKSKGRKTSGSPSPFAITRRAFLEMPLEYTEEDGVTLLPMSKMYMSTTFPLIGSLSGSLDGRAGIRGRNGYCATRAGLSCKLGPHNLSAVSLMGEDGLLQHVTVSADVAHSTSQTNLKLSLQSPSKSNFVKGNHAWKPRISVSKTIHEIFTIRTHATFLAVDRNMLQNTGDFAKNIVNQVVDSHSSTQLFTLADCPMKTTQYGIAIESQSRHPWSIALTNSRLRPYQMTLSMSPRLYHTGRSLTLSTTFNLLAAAKTIALDTMHFVWKLPESNKTATLSSLSSSIPFSQVKVGFSKFHSGLAWVFSFTTRGNFTLTIPIVIATAVVADPLQYPLQAMYLGAVSLFVQEMIVRFVCVDGDQRRRLLSKPLESDKDRRKRERLDAENQQALMRFQANRRKTAEKKANGLTINVAVYYTGKEKLDVTIPLQYWVVNSTLLLAETSKAKLLGFYDLSTEKKKSRHKAQPSWISGFWRRDKPSGYSRVTPKLSVEYTYAGAFYQLTIEDHEQLVLPNERAKLVKPVSSTTPGKQQQ